MSHRPFYIIHSHIRRISHMLKRRKLFTFTRRKLFMYDPYNPYYPSYYSDDEERIFNIPGLGNLFGPGSQPGGSPFFPGQPGGFPGQPGGPGGFPGGPGGGPPSGGQQGAPTTPPPSFTPQQPQFQPFAVDPGGILGCLFRFTYIWLNNNQAFWFFPTFVGRNSVAGFRWTGFRWVYFGIDLNRIQSFQCF